MKKFVLLIVCILFFCVFTPQSTNAMNIQGVVYDRIEYFTQEEIDEINAAAIEFYGSIKVNLYIVTNIDSFYYGEHFVSDFNLDIEDDAVVLILSNNDSRNYDLYTYGKATRKISDSEVDKILDNPLVYSNIKSGNYVDGVIAFIELSADAYTWSWVNSLVLGIILGLIGAAVTWFSVVGVYKLKTRSEKYPLSRFAKMELTRSNEVFMGSFVTKRVISSSGSRSSSGGSGGSSSGGGRGHRGGR